jgi:hypothetical protein
MQIRVGYEFTYNLPQPTPMILTVSVHYSRASDIVTPDHLITHPSVPITAYRDGFGNWCSRMVAPPGRFRISSNGVVRDTGLPDIVVPSVQQHAVKDLPEETLVFLGCTNAFLGMEVTVSVTEESPERGEGRG